MSTAETSLTVLGPLSRAIQLLSECNTIQEAKRYHDLAEAARVYAQTSKLGTEASNKAVELKLRAERRMGEILLLSQKHPGGRPEKTPNRVDRGLSEPTTYAEAGIEYRDASRWQALTRIPEEKFEKHIVQVKDAKEELTTASCLKLAQAIAKERRKDELAKKAENVPSTTDRYRLIHSGITSLHEHIDADSIDIIVTDHPYARSDVELYGDLAKVAVHCLKPGGLLLAMTGQLHHDLSFPLMVKTEGLSYQWELCYLTPGGQSSQIWQREFNTFWKPVLLFAKGECKRKWSSDVIKSATNDNDKRFHRWGQSESGMTDLLQRFVEPGDLVLDPFVGGGTTAVVALSVGCRFIGADIDEDALKITAGRIAECQRIRP